MSEPTRHLPSHPSFEQQKKLAKEILRAFEARETEAVARVRRALPDKNPIKLADAQFVLAREYGFENWAALKAQIEELTARELPPMEQAKRAVNARDPRRLRRVLNEHPEVRAAINEPLFSFDSPAIVALSKGENDFALIETLLDFGADPNRRSSWWAGGFHALHSAEGPVADLLIARGATPDACALSHLDRVDELAEMLRTDPARVHERGGDGQTALHFARSPRTVDLLLANGADIDARDVDHRGTPAQWMLKSRKGRGRYELASYLVKRGASVDIFLACALGLTDRLQQMLHNQPNLLDLRTGQGEYAEQPPSSYHIYTWTIGQNLSPLQVAAQFEQPGALAILRDFAPPRQQFLAACSTGDSAEAHALLRAHPGLLSELTEEDKRALPDAGWAPNPPAVELMLELGFDPAIVGHQGGTVLHCAACEGSAEAVRAVLSRPAGRALVHQRDPNYQGTPLGWCVYGACNTEPEGKDHATVARLLLEAGAEPVEDLDNAPAAVRAVIEGWVKR